MSVRTLLALVSAAVAVGIGGCGEIGTDWKGVRLRPSQVVPQRAVERLDQGSPERVVLEWFRAAQRMDAARALRLYSSRVHLSSNEMRFAIAKARPFFTTVGLRRVSDVTVQPRWATVFSELTYRWEAPNGRGQVVRRPQAFTLIRQGGKWRLADDYFLGFAASFRPARPRLS